MTFQNVSSLKDFKCVHPTIGTLCAQYVKETNNEGKTAVMDLLASECFNVVADVPAHTALKISIEIAQAIQNHDYANQSADVFDLLNNAFLEYVPDYRDEFTQDYLKTCVFNSEVIDAVQAQLNAVVGCVKYKQNLINILQKIRALKNATKKNLIKDRIKQGATILAKLTDVAEIQSSQLVDSYTRACIEFTSLHDITALEVITLVQDAVIDAHVDALPQYVKQHSSKQEMYDLVRPQYDNPAKICRYSNEFHK